MHAVGLVFARLGNEQIVKVCPVELNVWRAVLFLVLFRQREGLDDLAGVVQTKHVRAWPHPGLRNCLAETEIAKDVHGVGADLNAGTNLAQNRSLFVNLDLKTLAHTLANNSDHLDALIADLRKVMETLAAWHAEFRGLIADWDHVMATLASREQNLQGTIVEQDRVMAVLDQALSGGAAQGLHAAIAQGPEMVDNANHYLSGAAIVMGVVQQDTPAVKQLFIELASVMSGVGTAQENGPDKGQTVHMWRVYCATHCFEPSQ